MYDYGMQVSRTMFEKLTSTSSFLECKLSENLKSISVLVLEELYKLKKIYVYIFIIGLILHIIVLKY